MKLAETTYDNAETGCCARLDEAKWDDREFEWKDKLFLKDHIRAVGKWIKAMDAHVESLGKRTKRHLFYYATCPKCAKHFGRNQVVLFAEVE